MTEKISPNAQRHGVEMKESDIYDEVGVTIGEMFGVLDERTVEGVLGTLVPTPPSKPVHIGCQGITVAGNDCNAHPVRGESFCVGHMRSLGV